MVSKADVKKNTSCSFVAKDIDDVVDRVAPATRFYLFGSMMIFAPAGHTWTGYCRASKFWWYPGSRCCLARTGGWRFRILNFDPLNALAEAQYCQRFASNQRTLWSSLPLNRVFGMHIKLEFVRLHRQGECI